MTAEVRFVILDAGKTMSSTEVDAWLEMLGGTNAERVAVIRDLLRHANEDGMSAEDRTICRDELLRLGGQPVGRWPNNTAT